MKLTIRQLKHIIKENLLFENIQSIKTVQGAVGTAVDGKWGPNSQKSWNKWVDSNIDAIVSVIPAKSIKKEKLISVKSDPSEFGRLAMGETGGEDFSATSKLIDMYSNAGDATYVLGNKANIGGVPGQKLLKKFTSNNKIIATYFIPDDLSPENVQKRVPPNKFSKITSSSEVNNAISQYKTLSGGGEDTGTGSEDNQKKKDSSFSGTDQFLIDVLINVISENDKRKGFEDLMSLDGGTVGIAHFAAGGLGGLYDGMGDNLVKKFFGKYNPDIDSVSAIKKATKRGNGYCRVSKKGSSGDCWNSLPWWKDGMYDFVNSSEGAEVQKNAWLKSHGRPALELANSYSSIHPEWKTKRGIAVMVCFVNSGGQGGGKSWSNSGNRTPNEAIDWYAENKAKRVRSRFRAINHYYPDTSGNFRPKFNAKAYNSYSPSSISNSYRKQYTPKGNKQKKNNPKLS